MKNKFVIPAILAATVLIAGVFAFMPVQEATTVHTQLGVLNTKTATNQVIGGGAAVVDIIADSAEIKTGTFCNPPATDANANDAISLRVESDAAGAVITVVDTDLETADGDCSDFVGFRLFVAGPSDAGDLLSYAVSWQARAP